MNLKEEISFEEFNGKKFKIRFFEPEDNKSAVVSHYLNNKSNGVAKKFKEEAYTYVKQLIEYKYPSESEVTNIVAENALQYMAFEVENVPFPAPRKPKFTFIDLFAGIGGFRLSLQNLGGKCVYTSEWDEQAQITYKANFGDIPFGDITRPETKKYIPDNFVDLRFIFSGMTSRSNHFTNS